MNNSDFFNQNPYFQSINKFFGGNVTRGNIAVNVEEKTSAYQVEAELPGCLKENISLEIVENQLKIVAIKKSNGKDNRLARTIHFPHTISKKKTKASYHNGLLRIIVPKQRGSQIEINDESSNK